jgi:hypothetical protein
VVGWVAAGIAGVTCVALYLEAHGVRLPCFRRPLALVMLLAAIASYAHFFELNAQAFYHRWEMFHYFLGSKYANELGYERLYECTAIAEAELSDPARVAARRLRDLRSDAIISAAPALTERQVCKGHFSSERWAAFSRDVAFFRRESDPRAWQQMQIDHGYNPAPAWTLVGRALSSLAPASSHFLQLLALIDPLLMAGTLGLLAWAFGARAAWLAGVFWSTQAPSSFYWTGGAFLRQDWLFLVVAALALLRKGRPFWAGFALAWAASLRVFPVLLFAGPLLVIVGQWLRTRRVLAAQRAFVAGGALSFAVALGATLVAFGPAYHAQFAEHIAMHSSTPVANHMSLRCLFSIGPEALIQGNEEPNAVDPTARWARARLRHFARFRSAYWLTVALLAAAFVLTVVRLRTLWVALGASLLLVMLLTDPSSYYYSLWIVAAPLVLARRVLTLPFIGLAAAGQLIVLQVPAMDVKFAALSALYLAFSVLVVCVCARPRFGLAGFLHRRQ